MKHRHLFQPITIGSTRIKNRIAMAPVNNAMQMDQLTGQATMTTVDYFAERARGGVGLIVTGTMKVDYEVEPYIVKSSGIKKWSYFSPQSTIMLAEMVARAHAYDAKFFFQLTAGPGRVAVPDSIDSGVQPVSSSPNRAFWRPDVTCRELETGEVERIVDAYRNAAVLARSIGADGIEIHGHEGYLIDQFTTALWNRRTDKYGGDLRGRLTFPIEILTAIKEAAGDDFTVTYRLGVRHYIESPMRGALHDNAPEVGRGIEESIEVAKMLESAGYDGFSLDVGAYESTYWAHPPYYFPHGFSLESIAKVKQAIGVPVMVAGRLGKADVADRAIAEGLTDMVALGRDLLADPEWPNKVARDEVDDIRPCIGCHEGCMDRPTFQGLFMSCTVNPSTSRERNARLIPVREKGKRILVAGGGAAGMEFARVAASRGHDVTIWEQGEELGGNMLQYGAPAFKNDVLRLLGWYRRTIERSAVTVEFGRRADAAAVIDFDPDVVVAATGSSYRHDALPGAEAAHVLRAPDVLSGDCVATGDVVIVGGGSHAGETALMLAQRGHRVTIVEKGSVVVAKGISMINREHLIDQLADLGVTVHVDTRAVRVVEGGIEVVGGDRQPRVLLAETVIMAIGMTANDSLYTDLAGTIPELHQIGDCKQPRYIHDAIFEGWFLGVNI